MKPSMSKCTKRKACELWSELRYVQRATGCTNSTLKETFRRLKKISGIDDKMHVDVAAMSGDKYLIMKSGVVGIRVDGCAGCNEHVFLPSELQIYCPKCRHPRFDKDKKPNEVNANNVVRSNNKKNTLIIALNINRFAGIFLSQNNCENYLQFPKFVRRSCGNRGDRVVPDSSLMCTTQIAGEGSPVQQQQRFAG